MERKFVLLGMMAMLTLVVGCRKNGDKAAGADEVTVRTRLGDADNDVRTIKLAPRDFSYELISNGKVAASQFADLVFPRSGVIEKVFVRNGDRVAKGQAVASLDTYSQQSSIKQAKVSMEQAKLELQDILIGQGYAPDDLSRVPKEVMRLAMIKSGYERCRNDLELSKYELSNSVLRAPFSGVVANLKGKAHNMTSSDPVCRIISTDGMEVEFPVLENELQFVRKGESVVVSPIDPSNGSVKGVVTEINPLVDENGMIKVTARVANGSRLISGMNVTVSVRRSLRAQIVVPKSALVHRSGRLVVFSVEDGKAVWHYVTTGAENMNECVVTKGLDPGMEVIVAGNQNLSHGTEVKIHN